VKLGDGTDGTAIHFTGQISFPHNIKALKSTSLAHAKSLLKKIHNLYN